MNLEEGILAQLPRAAELMEGLSADQINWRPAESAWSIAECIAHMNSFNSQYADAIHKAISDGKRRGLSGGTGEAKLGIFARQFLHTIEPPYRIKFKAPSIFRPQGSSFDRDDLLMVWNSTHVRLGELAKAAEGVDLERVKVRSPLSPLLKVSLQVGLMVVPAHDRRHIWQAGRVRQNLEQPSRSAT